MATIQWRKHKTKSGTTLTATLNWSDGGRHRESLGAVTPEDAETARIVKEAELRTGRIIFSKAPLFSELAQYYLSWHASEYPDSHYRVKQIIEDYLLPAFQYLPLDQIRAMQAERYKADRLAVHSEGTVSKEIRTLKAMMNKAVAWELIEYSPIHVVSPPRVLNSRPPHWYSMEELQVLYEDSGSHAPIWQLMANTGIRRGEAQHLMRKHDKGESIVILSEPRARTKSAKWREVPLSVNGREALDSLFSASRNDYALPVMNPSSLSRAFAHDKGELGGSLHSLRHTFGSHLAIKGTQIRVLQELMGHASIKTTERYMHVAQQHLTAAIHGFSI